MGSHKKTPGFVQLVSNRLDRPLASIVPFETHLKLPLRIKFIPRFIGYHGQKAALQDDVVRLQYVQSNADGSFSEPKKMGEFNFASVDLSEVLPETSKIVLHDAKEEEEPGSSDESDAEKDEDEEFSDSDEDSSISDSSDSSAESDNPRDGNYEEAGWEERLQECPDTFNWSPAQGIWQFGFSVDRDNRCLVLTKLRFEVVRKKKSKK